MFLQDLTQQEKKAFLTLAKDFIMVDGVLSQEETSLVEQMTREMSTQDAFDEGHYSRRELCAMFQTRRSQFAAIIEMQGLGYANLEYHTSEKEFIQEMANYFNIDSEALSNIDEWVVKQMALLYEAQDFWTEQTQEA